MIFNSTQPMFHCTTVVPSVSGGLSAEQSSKLQDLLRSVRRSDKDAKMRLAALQWSAALFKHDQFVIETAYLLAGASYCVFCEYVAFLIVLLSKSTVMCH